MVKLSRISLILIGIVILSYILPLLYWKVFATRSEMPYISYSAVDSTFYTRKVSHKKNHYWHTNGAEISKQEFESALPMVYFRQLWAMDLMPDSIGGVKMDVFQLTQERTNFVLRPSYLSAPNYGLNLFFETAPGSVVLELPDDFFRFKKDRLEFIQAESNRIDKAKSKAATEELIKAGFDFPAILMGGIPNQRKLRDEGYFVLDNSQHLFHIMYKKDKLEVDIVPIYRDLKIKHIACAEQKLREYYALIVSQTNELYVLLVDDYQLIKLPVDGFIPEKHTLRISGNLFNKQLSINGDGFTRCVVLDRDFKLIAEETQYWTPSVEGFAGKLASFIFPYTIRLQDNLSVYIQAKIIRNHTYWFLFINGLWLALFIWIKRYKKKPINIVDVVFIAVFGMYAFWGTLVFSSNDE